MKIALVYDAVYPYVKGGVEKRLYDLATGLAKRHEVHVFGMKFWPGGKVIKIDGVFYHGVCSAKRLYKKNGKRGMFQPLFFSTLLSKELLKHDFDIIDCQNFPYLPFFSAKAYSLLKGKPLVVTWHEYWGDYWYDYLGPAGIFGKLIERTVLRMSKNNISVSRHTLRKLGRNGVRSVLVPISFDFERISAAMPAGEKTDIIFAGRLNKEKNVRLLLKSLAVLKGGSKEPSCVIIGDGPEREGLQKMAASLGLERTRFVGFLPEDNVYSCMKSAGVFVSTSYREGFGMAAMEALLCGCGLVTVNHENNAVKDLVSDEFISDIDEKSLAKKILWALSGPRLARKNDYRSQDEMAEEVEKFYGALK